MILKRVRFSSRSLSAQSSPVSSPRGHSGSGSPSRSGSGSSTPPIAASRLSVSVSKVFPFIHKKRSHSSENSDESPEKGGSEERGSVSVGEEICQVIVVVGVKVKGAGMLRCSDGEFVTLMQATNLGPGEVVAKNRDGELGKVPRNAVLISQHCWNLYLNVLPFLIHNPQHLEIVIRNELTPRPVLVDLLDAKGLLKQAMEALLALEDAKDVAFREGRKKNLLSFLLLKWARKKRFSCNDAHFGNACSSVVD